ncbi:MAG: hypothetical protein PHO08_06315 [Methylococcales bacterium]|nr:hypothetical protein [Methylococcales bacterium]MDD5632541.1 hypothetical protein [Methylococcales bacterium]
MKRIGRIWPEVISFENLLSAYHKARKGKRSKPAVAGFTLNLEIVNKTQYKSLRALAHVGK